MKKADPEKIARLESPERRQMIDFQAVLDLLPLTPMLTIADVGCGTGYFAMPLARKLSKGTVYAIDVSPDMLAVVENKIAQENVGNIKIVCSEEESIPLPDESVDAVLAALVLHEVESVPATLKEIRRILRPHGWLAVVEWKKSETPKGPSQDERLSPEEIAGQVAGMGMELFVVHDLNPNQYVAMFSRE